MCDKAQRKCVIKRLNRMLKKMHLITLNLSFGGINQLFASLTEERQEKTQMCIKLIIKVTRDSYFHLQHFEIVSVIIYENEPDTYSKFQHKCSAAA